jgi:hypothetical protein
MQHAIVSHVAGLLVARQSHYDSVRELLPALSNSVVDWRKPTLITGKAGTGKSVVLKSIVKNSIAEQRHVLVCTPTGFLSSGYREFFDQLTDCDLVKCDTIHSAFCFPVGIEEQPTVNWSVGQYELVIIDELSMVAGVIFRHVLHTFHQLPRKPILVLGGDNAQLQPIMNVGGRVMTVGSIMDDVEFVSSCFSFALREQHRLEDPMFESILNHIRYWYPSKRILETLQEGRLLCSHSNPSDGEILNALVEHEKYTMLTVSRKATCRVNRIVIECILSNLTPLGTVQMDCDLPPMPIYRGMKVMVTQNRDKVDGVVNGQSATIAYFFNRSVFLRFASGKIVSLHLVTMERNGERVTCYPFCPGYSMTICKAQGQTLERCILWLDCNILHP